jgi:hypothetical protein
MNYIERLKIPINGGPDDRTRFYSKSGIWVASGYNRVVVGGRGPYIEFERKNFSGEAKLIIPDSEIWRYNSNYVYYVEWRACPMTDNIKVYYQKKEVSYAGYKIGKFYISPFDLNINETEPIIEKLRRKISGC